MLDIFTNETSTHKQVQKAGENFILNLYGVGNYKSLDEFRYISLKKVIGRMSFSSSFQLSTLPPRAYLTVQEWMGLSLYFVWLQKDGVYCSILCMKCNGQTCNNTPPVIYIDSDEEIDEPVSTILEIDHENDK